MFELTGDTGELSQSSQADALLALEAQIIAHREHERSKSYLASAISMVTGTGDKSLNDLEQLKQGALDSKSSATAGALTSVIAEKVQADKEALTREDEINHYAGGFFKTAALFARGKLGLAGTVAIYALDQMRPADSIADQLTDLGLGATKGALLKGTFHVLGQKPVGVAAKGVGLGLASRILETGLSRSTYLDPANGEVSLSAGLSRVVRDTLNKKAIVADAIVFGLAHGTIAGANTISGGALGKSALASTMLTGTSFGLAGGAAGEVMRQDQAGENFDLAKIVKRSLLQGAIDTFAAAPGGFMARAEMRSAMKSSPRETDLNLTSGVKERWTPSSNGQRRAGQGRLDAAIRPELFERDRLEHVNARDLETQARTPLASDVNVGTFVKTMKDVIGSWTESTFAHTVMARSNVRDAEALARAEIARTVGIPKDQFHESAVMRAHLAGRQDLLSLYEKYITARDNYANEQAKLNELPQRRKKELEAAINAYGAERGLPPVSISMAEDLGKADAAYRTGQGVMLIRAEDFRYPNSSRNLYDNAFHEYVHHEQDALLIRMYADIVAKRGLAADAQLEAVKMLYQKNVKAELSMEFLRRVMEIRGGRELSPEETARARDIERGKAANQDTSDLDSQLKVVEYWLKAFVQGTKGSGRQPGRAVPRANTAQDLALRLSEGTVNPTRLFGTAEINPEVKKVVESVNAAEWDANQARFLFRLHLGLRAEALRKEIAAAYEIYRELPHELEAWAAGELARRKAKTMGEEALDDATNARMLRRIFGLEKDPED